MTVPEATSRSVLRFRDLDRSGMSRHDYKRATARLTPVARGAHAELAGLGPEEAHRIRATEVLARMTRVVASHATALTLWGLPVLVAQLEHVHVSPTRSRSGRPGSNQWYRMHATPVDEIDQAVVDGLPVTGVPRTLVDVARALGLDWGVASADAAMRRGLVSRESLEAAAMVTTRLTGGVRARALPALVSPLAESPGESLLRLRLQRMGVQPLEQAVLDHIPGRPRVDFLVDENLVIEFDGRAKYSLKGDPEAAVWAEKVRQDHLVDGGCEVMRVIWAHLWDEPELAARVDRARRRAQARKAP